MPLYVAMVAPPIAVTGTVTSTPSGTQNVAVTSPVTFPVSGTVTTTPSGTQTVAGTVTTSPSGTQNVAVTSPATFPVSGTVTTTPSGTQTVTGSVVALPAIPAGSNFYITALADIPGVVAANNFLSIFNPLGSGKTITMYALSIVPWATAATSITVSMNIFRISAASAGSLVAAANIGKFTSSSPNAIAEVRSTNPTVTTTGLTLGGVPPADTSSGSGASPTGSGAAPSAASFMLLPGEGLVMKTASGSVAQLWNFDMIWAEA